MSKNQRLINLCQAIDEFHCPQWVKDVAYELFGITSETIYKNPLQEQLDRINDLFDDLDEPKKANADAILAMIRKRRPKD